MAVPMPTNITFDIYHASTPGPPHAPDVAGVKGYMRPYGQSTLTTNNYTHKMWCPVSVDIRDGTTSVGNLTGSTDPDSIWVPNKNGQMYKVILVRRIGRGTALDCYLVLLQRQQVSSWPQSNL
jgi:hypothetical protein